MTKLKPPFDTLSADALGALKGLFAYMTPKSELAFGNVESRPSDRARAALEELTKASILNYTKDGQREVWKLQPDVDMTPIRKMAFPKDGNFKITEPIHEERGSKTPKVSADQAQG